MGQSYRIKKYEHVAVIDKTVGHEKYIFYTFQNDKVVEFLYYSDKHDRIFKTDTTKTVLKRDFKIIETTPDLKSRAQRKLLGTIIEKKSFEGFSVYYVRDPITLIKSLKNALNKKDLD